MFWVLIILRAAFNKITSIFLVKLDATLFSIWGFSWQKEERAWKSFRLGGGVAWKWLHFFSFASGHPNRCLWAFPYEYLFVTWTPKFQSNVIERTSTYKIQLQILRHTHPNYECPCPNKCPYSHIQHVKLWNCKAIYPIFKTQEQKKKKKKHQTNKQKQKNKTKQKKINI